MLLSTRRSISYPNPDRSDRPDIPTHLLNLVNGLEVDVVYVQGTAAARAAAAHMAGVIWRETDTGLFYWDTGSVWVSLGTSTAAVEADQSRRGTNGAKPAANSVNPGVVYYESDTGLNYRSDGAVWNLISSTPSGETGSGTIGTRPAANTVPAGYLYFATDNGLVYRSDGAAWTLMSAAAGAELDVAQITAAVASNTTTEGAAVAIITGSSVTYDGTKVKIEFWCPSVTDNAASANRTFLFLRDTTVLGQWFQDDYGVTNAQGAPMTTYDTPTAGAHTYSVKMFVSTGTVTVQAGTGGSGAKLPATLRVTKA